MSEPNDELVENQEGADDDAEASALAVEMGGNKMVPLSALIAAKREGKTLKGRIKELEPVAARAVDIDTRLTNAQPYIDAIVNNPQLKAAALRAVNGTRASGDATVQPEAQEDPEAAEFAEIQGMYLADGQTPDIARAQRALRLFDARHGRQTTEMIRPLAGVTLGARGNENLRAIMNMTDNDGVPFATPESIKEAASMMEGQASLMADPRVTDMLLNQAIGIDKRKGRTPQAVDEPLYLSPAGGGRGRPRDNGMDADMTAFAAKYGIKDAAATVAKLEQGVNSRKGVTFGKS